MINIILTGFLNLVILLCKLILMPVDALISKAMPDLSTFFDAVNSLFSLLQSVIGFVVDLFGLSSLAISILITYYTFKLTVPITVHVIKFVVKWYNTLKP